MVKHLLAKAHIAKWEELTQSEVTELTSSVVDETALPILTRQWSRGITIVSSQRKIIFDFQVDPYRPKWHTKCSKMAGKDFETSEFHQDRWNRDPMLGFLSVHIPWKALSNLELRQSNKALRADLVLLSAPTITNICWREYALTLDAIKKQLPLWNKVSSALHRWTWPNKLAITSDIAQYMDRNWSLCEVQLAFDEVDNLFFPHYES